MNGTSAIKYHHPLLPVSCRRLTSTAKDGKKNTRTATKFIIGIIANIKLNKTQNQYSDLLARPLNVAYLLKQALIAPPNEFTVFLFGFFFFSGAPHFIQTIAKGSGCAPQLEQYLLPLHDTGKSGNSTMNTYCGIFINLFSAIFTEHINIDLSWLHSSLCAVVNKKKKAWELL